MKKTELTLNETVSLMNHVLDELNQGDTDAIDLVVAIENGGTFFGRYLAEKLNKPFERVRIQFYGVGETAGELPLHVDIDMNKLIGKRILLVDDIVDSGRTVAYFKNMTQLKQPEQFVLVSLHYCNGSVVTPNYYGATKDKNEWIIYPWERVVTFEEWWNELCKK